MGLVAALLVCLVFVVIGFDFRWLWYVRVLLWLSIDCCCLGLI